MVSSLNRFVVLTSAVGLTLSLPTVQPRTENLVVFGDSLSDNGAILKVLMSSDMRLNDCTLAGSGAWTLSNGTWPADPAYVGHRFSNRPVWAESLATSLGWELADYAVGRGGITFFPAYYLCFLTCQNRSDKRQCRRARRDGPGLVHSVPFST
jgi:hypothetical protein